MAKPVVNAVGPNLSTKKNKKSRFWVLGENLDAGSVVVKQRQGNIIVRTWSGTVGKIAPASGGKQKGLATVTCDNPTGGSVPIVDDDLGDITVTVTNNDGSGEVGEDDGAIIDGPDDGP